jgi:hypothetical protein
MCRKGCDELHGDGSDEWDELYVHGDCHESVRYWFGFDGIFGGCSVDGSGCSYWCGGDGCCKYSVGCVVDCTGVEWWCFDQFVLGDLGSWFVHVYERNNLVHGDGSDEWFELYVHGDSDECVGHERCVGCVVVGCSVDGSGCSYWCGGDGCCEHSVGGVVDCAGVAWWGVYQFVHGDGVGCFWDFYDESEGSVGR